MNEIIIIVAKYFILLPLTLAIVVAYQLPNSKARINYGIALVVGGLIALILARVAGLLILDPRPFVVGHFLPLISHAADNGFPSDHTLFASLLGWTTLRYSKKYGIVILCLSLIIGLSRVLAGVHHVEDIIGAFVVSGVAMLVVRFAMDRIEYTKRV